MDGVRKRSKHLGGGGRKKGETFDFIQEGRRKKMKKKKENFEWVPKVVRSPSAGSDE